MSFDAFNAEVDAQVLSLRRHRFARWPAWSGRQWRMVRACEHCGLKFDWYRQRQICLGVLGELMLAGEKIPVCWRGGFADRVRVGHRTWKKKARAR